MVSFLPEGPVSGATSVMQVGVVWVGRQYSRQVGGRQGKAGRDTVASLKTNITFYHTFQHCIHRRAAGCPLHSSSIEASTAHFLGLSIMFRNNYNPTACFVLPPIGQTTFRSPSHPFTCGWVNSARCWGNN